MTIGLNIKKLMADNKKKGKARGANGKKRGMAKILAIDYAKDGENPHKWKKVFWCKCDSMKIGPLEFEVVEYDSTSAYKKLMGNEGSSDMFGICQTYPKTQIIINSLQDPQSKQLTLLHEVLEAINFLYEIKLSERDIKTLEATLGQVLKDNPSFTKGFIQAT